MVNLFKKIWCICIFSLFLGVIFAQEDQVSFIPGMLELTKEQREKAGVLTAYSDHFHKALLYERQDDYLLVVEFGDDTLRWTEDVPMSTSKVEVLRDSLQLAFTSSLNQKSEEIDSLLGRVYLIGSISIHALLQGRILSNVFNSEKTQSGSFGTSSYDRRTEFNKSFPYLVMIGALSGSVWQFYGKPVPPSAANMHFWGSLLGYGHGYLLTSLYREPYSTQNRNFENIIMLSTSLLEGWASYRIAKRHNFTYVQSKAINVGNFWGGVTGLMSYGVFTRDTEFQYNTFGIYGLMGSGIGLFTSNYLINKFPRTSGDLSAINAAGAVGSSWGLATNLAFDLDGRDAYSSLLLGTLGAITIAGLVTKNTNLSIIEGGMANLGAITGGAIGLIGGVLIYATSFSLATGVSIGMTLGILIGPSLIPKSALNNNLLGIGKKIRWEVNPAGIGMMISSPENQANLMRQNTRMDLISLKYSF